MPQKQFPAVRSHTTTIPYLPSLPGRCGEDLELEEVAKSLLMGVHYLGHSDNSILKLKLHLWIPCQNHSLNTSKSIWWIKQWSNKCNSLLQSYSSIVLKKIQSGTQVTSPLSDESPTSKQPTVLQYRFLHQNETMGSCSSNFKPKYIQIGSTSQSAKRWKAAKLAQHPSVQWNSAR